MSLSVVNKLKPSLRDRLIPWYFVMAFAVVFIVNGFFVYAAIKSNHDVVTINPYEKGLAYNEVITKADEQAALGWHGDVVYENDKLQFTLKDKAGKAIIGANVVAILERPIGTKEHLRVVLNEASFGIYEKAMTFPLKGQWEVKIHAIVDAESYQIKKRLIIK